MAKQHSAKLLLLPIKFSHNIYMQTDLGPLLNLIQNLGCRPFYRIPIKMAR